MKKIFAAAMLAASTAYGQQVIESPRHDVTVYKNNDAYCYHLADSQEPVDFIKIGNTFYLPENFDMTRIPKYTILPNNKTVKNDSSFREKMKSCKLPAAVPAPK